MHIYPSDNNFETSIKELLLGRKIIEAAFLRNNDAILILDNGLVLLIECESNSEDGYESEYSYVNYLNCFPHVITNITFSNTYAEEGFDDKNHEVRVFSEDKETILYSVQYVPHYSHETGYEDEINYYIAVYGGMNNEE